MRRIELRYREGTRTAAVPEVKLAGIYQPCNLPGVPDLAGAVQAALENPVGRNDLPALASRDKTVVRTVPTVDDGGERSGYNHPEDPGLRATRAS
jgi:hypothetical protein